MRVTHSEYGQFLVDGDHFWWMLTIFWKMWTIFAGDNHPTVAIYRPPTSVDSVVFNLGSSSAIWFEKKCHEKSKNPIRNCQQNLTANDLLYGKELSQCVVSTALSQWSQEKCYLFWYKDNIDSHPGNVDKSKDITREIDTAKWQFTQWHTYRT